jgi:hypothetical protein
MKARMLVTIAGREPRSKTELDGGPAIMTPYESTSIA